MRRIPQPQPAASSSTSSSAFSSRTRRCSPPHLTEKQPRTSNVSSSRWTPRRIPLLTSTTVTASGGASCGTRSRVYRDVRFLIATSTILVMVMMSGSRMGVLARSSHRQSFFPRGVSGRILRHSNLVAPYPTTGTTAGFSRRNNMCGGGCSFVPSSVVTRQSLGWKNAHSWRNLAVLKARSKDQRTEPKQKQQKHLVIVESPAKCATIAKILNSNNDKDASSIHYTVKSCMGHLRNLPKRVSSPPVTKRTKNKKGSPSPSKKMESTAAPAETTTTPPKFPYVVAGIDLNGGQYAPSYIVMEGKKAIVRDLQQLVAEADQVLLATDPDREGEAMAWHLAELLQLTPATTDTATTTTADQSSSTRHQTPYHRIRFTEITHQAITAAVQATKMKVGNVDDTDSSSSSSSSSSHSGRINDHLVAAQETRRVLDRLAGYTVSPVLWKKIAPGLSAGRVQSVGLQLIVARELERLAFQSVHYYDLTAQLQTTTTNQQRGHRKLLPTTRLVSINGTAVAVAGKDFTAQGVLSSASQHKYHLTTESKAVHWVDRMTTTTAQPSRWMVHSIISRQRTTPPPRPYKTSTLQQEAARRLGLPVQVTMSTAQQLYEAGCISYMRTDSTTLSHEGETAVADSVTRQFGAHMLRRSNADDDGQSKKKVKKKDKFAQEAHEAIRPAIQTNGKFWKLDELPPTVTAVAVQLYRMIYQRTLAHRMFPLVTNQTQVVIQGIQNNDDATTTEMMFRTSGSLVVSPGYTLVYNNNNDDRILRDASSEGGEGNDDNNDSAQLLPPLVEGQVLELKELLPVGHETQPPPRYTEASFVKELEALGVGRPSTYAGVVQLLRDRAYVGSPATGANDNRRSSNHHKTPTGSAISAVRAAGGTEFTGGGGSARGPLVPSLSAIVVCALLAKYCPTYIDPTFTAQMEERLDQIASGEYAAEMTGEEQRIAYLDEFYAGENGLAAQIKHIEDTVDASEARRAVLPALSNIDGEQVGLFIGPWGPYVQQVVSNVGSDEKHPTAQLPPGMAADISTIKPTTLKALLTTKQDGGAIFGQHPSDGRNIRLKTGRFGAYLQWGDDKEEGTTTHSLPRHKASMRQFAEIEAFPDDDDGGNEGGSPSLDALLGVTLAEAIAYLSLPRIVSNLNDKPIVAGIGPYGPYLKYNGKFMNLNEGDVLTIDAETAERLVVDGIINATSKLGRGVIAELGEKEGSKVTVKAGRFGAYLNWKRVNAKLPADYTENPEGVPLDEAWSLIQAKAGPKTDERKKTSKSSTKKSSSSHPPPKRPMSAYLYFCALKRPVVLESVKSLGDVSKKLALMWAETDDRQEFKEMAAAAKTEYEEKMRVWEVDGNPSGNKAAAKAARLTSGAATAPRKRAKPSATSGTKKRLTTGKSKEKSLLNKMAPSSTPRAASAYMLFCREFRPLMVDESGEKLPFGETTKRLATKWRECDEETRSKFQQQAAEAKVMIQSTIQG